MDICRLKFLKGTYVRRIILTQCQCHWNICNHCFKFCENVCKCLTDWVWSIVNMCFCCLYLFLSVCVFSGRQDFPLQFFKIRVLKYKKKNWKCKSITRKLQNITNMIIFQVLFMFGSTIVGKLLSIKTQLIKKHFDFRSNLENEEKGLKCFYISL